MADEKFELTRRKALAGLGTIGAASAGAGLGTSAYFNDTESFDGNSLTAGTLNLVANGRVEATNHPDGIDGANGDVTFVDTTADDPVDGGDNTSEGVRISDAKPGDWYIVCFDLNIEGNPAYLGLSASVTSDTENGYTEPEPNPGLDTDNGELDDKLEAAFYDSNSINDASSDALSDYLGGDPIEAGGTMASYFPVGDSAPLLLNGGSAVSAGGTYTVCLVLEIPNTVGNEIQGDGVGFQVDFHAVQERHNDGQTFPSSS